MTELNIKTLDELLHKDKTPIADVKRMIERYGIYVFNRWHEWEAAPADKENSEKSIQAALFALGEYADIHASAEISIHQEYYRNPDDQKICKFGFNLDKNGNLCVEKTLLQTQEDQLLQVQSELHQAKQEIIDLKNRLEEISTWTGFDDVDKNIIPAELDFALQVYRSAVKNYDPNTGKMNNDETVKQWMKRELANTFEIEAESVLTRIAMVANWSKDAGRPKK